MADSDYNSGNNWLWWRVENIIGDKELKEMRHLDVAYLIHLNI